MTGSDLEKVIKCINGWSRRDMEGISIRYSEYKNALGEDATKSFDEFMMMIAHQTVLYREVA